MMEEFELIDIGPSTAETVKLQYQIYTEADRYRHGKTFKELMDEMYKKPHK